MAYQPQSTCDPTAKAGTRYVLDMVQAYWGGRKGGIARSCDSGGVSEHKEGRAFDWMVDAARPSEKAAADAFIAWLMAAGPDGKVAYNARRLGVMYVIWNGRIWNNSSQTSTWRTYTGANPHTDHVHVSLSWQGALARTSWWLGGAAIPARFWDVPYGHQFFTEVEWLAERRITNGLADGSFGARQPVTREAMAAFLFRDTGIRDYRPPAVAPFPDVPVGHQFYTEISWLRMTGITTGLGDGTFGALAPVSREAMAAFLFRYAAPEEFAPPATQRFTDVPVDHQFFREISWLAQTGITTGLGDGSFGASEPITREAMAAFLYRFNQRVKAPST